MLGWATTGRLPRDERLIIRATISMAAGGYSIWWARKKNERHTTDQAR